MLLRHAKAVPADTMTRDRDRALDSRGRQDAPKIGAYMVLHGLVPDRALVSPAKRTRETWALAAQAFPAPPPASFEDRLYEASPQTLLAMLQEQGPTCPSLLVVGHNPTLHRVAVELIAAGDLEAREQLREALPTSGLVTIEFAIDSWTKLHLQGGRLSHFVTPRSLEAATD
jgi:phosphohistidine phosphatase